MSYVSGGLRPDGKRAVVDPEGIIQDIENMYRERRNRYNQNSE